MAEYTIIPEAKIRNTLMVLVPVIFIFIIYWRAYSVLSRIGVVYILVLVIAYLILIDILWNWRARIIVADNKLNWRGVFTTKSVRFKDISSMKEVKTKNKKYSRRAGDLKPRNLVITTLEGEKKINNIQYFQDMNGLYLELEQLTGRKISRLV